MGRLLKTTNYEIIEQDVVHDNKDLGRIAEACSKFVESGHNGLILELTEKFTGKDITSIKPGEIVKILQDIGISLAHFTKKGEDEYCDAVPESGYYFIRTSTKEILAFVSRPVMIWQEGFCRVRFYKWVK